MLSFDHTHNHFLVDGQPVSFSAEELEQMKKMQWWHDIPFAPGIRSPGLPRVEDFAKHYFQDKVDFKGKSVLDIGCWDGGQLYYAEAQGASRMVGIDDLTQRHAGESARDFARRKLKSKAEFVDLNVYDLTPDRLGMFDIVCMWGVLYHLIHPMLGLERACSVCKETFLFATHFRMTETTVPLCTLYPSNELNNDLTNWSGPNIPWIWDALDLQGFKVRSHLAYDTHQVSVWAERVKPQSTLIGASYTPRR